MVQQLQAGTYIDTYFRLLLVDSGFLFKVEIKIRTGSQINTGQATQADVILQVNRDINTVLLHSNIRVGIRNLDTSLGKKQRSIYPQPYDWNIKLSHWANKEAGKIILLKVFFHIREARF